MRFKFKVNLFSEEKPKQPESGKKQRSGERTDRKRFPKPFDLPKNLQKSSNNLPPPERRHERDSRYNHRMNDEEREPVEDMERAATPPRRASSNPIKPPRVGARRDFPALRKAQPKLALQNKISKKVDARLDALREQLGFEFDHEYGAQRMQHVDSTNPPPNKGFERTRSVPARRNPQTATEHVRQMPFARNPVPPSAPPQGSPPFNGQGRRPSLGGNQGSSFAPYSRPRTMLVREQQKPPQARPQQPVKPQVRKADRNEAKSGGVNFGILGVLFSSFCTPDSGCNKVQSGCAQTAGCSNIEAGCTSAKKFADGSMFDAETLWTQSETLSETEYDDETRFDGETRYDGETIYEQESDGSDSEFDDESSWGDATSYRSEDETHHYDRQQKHKAPPKKDRRKQGNRSSSRSPTKPEKAETKPVKELRQVFEDGSKSNKPTKKSAQPVTRNSRSEKRGNKPLRKYDDETHAYWDSESDKQKQSNRGPSRRSPTSQKGGNKKSRRHDDETFYSAGDSSSFDDTYYHTEYDGESQWTDGETYFTRDTRRTRRHHGRHTRRDSESSLSDSESDYSSSYYSDDSYDTRTYSDSWSMDDETRYTKYMSRRGGYDDETMYTREHKRGTKKVGGRR